MCYSVTVSQAFVLLTKALVFLSSDNTKQVRENKEITSFFEKAVREYLRLLQFADSCS